MIRINLLPIRQIKKRVRARNEVLVFITSLVLLLALLGGAAWSLNQKVTSTKETIASLNKKKAQYNAIINEMKQLDADRAKLTVKIDAIKQLKSKSQTTVRLLDEIAKATPDSIWLESLRQAGANVSLTGIALDNTRLADYMDSLTASPYFSSATLGRSSLKEIAGQKLKSFSLTLSITIPETKTSDSKQEAAQ